MKNRFLILCLAFIISLLAVFWQVRNYDFVLFDDPVYILDNPHVKGGLTPKAISWAFTSLYGGFWFPMTWLSHMVDCQLYGLDPAGPHLTNLLLHIANSLLLLYVLYRMTGALWKSAFAAALFAFHPLHVEPIAWVSGRKDLLSTLFMMLTLWSYIHYTKRPGLMRYLPVLLFFVLGLMSKPMLVTMPFVLLLLDFWPLGRFSLDKGLHAAKVPDDLPKNPTGADLILEKIPLLILALISSVLVYLAESHYGAVRSLDAFPLDVRLSNACVSYMRYIHKMLWPQGLVFFYPHGGMPPLWETLGSILFLGCLSFAAIRWAKRFPYFPVGWLFFMITLLPVIGLVQVGVHSMADRYSYVPLIGLFIAISWGVPDLMRNFRFRKSILAITAGIISLSLMILSWSQAQSWRDSITLFRHAIKATPNNYVAHNNLGLVLAQRGNLEEAYLHFSKALAIKPDYMETLNNMGVILARLGRLNEAVSAFSRLLRMDPKSVGTNFYLGLTLLRQEKFREAAVYFSRVLQLQPNSPEANFYLGIIFYKEKKFTEAASYFSRALSLKPDYIEARRNLEMTLKKLGNEGDHTKAYP